LKVKRSKLKSLKGQVDALHQEVKAAKKRLQDADARGDELREQGYWLDEGQERAAEAEAADADADADQASVPAPAPEAEAKKCSPNVMRWPACASRTSATRPWR
jgi:chromosome segregation ATPase